MEVALLWVVVVVVVERVQMANLDPFLWSVVVRVEVVLLWVVVVFVVPVHFQSFPRMSLKKTMTTMAVVVQWAVVLRLVLRERVVVVARDRMANLVPFVFFGCQFP